MWNLISVCLGGENILALQKNNNNSKTYFHLEIAPLIMLWYSIQRTKKVLIAVINIVYHTAISHSRVNRGTTMREDYMWCFQ